jgi:hypothetical protein
MRQHKWGEKSAVPGLQAWIPGAAGLCVAGSQGDGVLAPPAPIPVIWRRPYSPIIRIKMKNYASKVLCQIMCFCARMKVVIPVGWENAPSTWCILGESAKKRKKNFIMKKKFYTFYRKFFPDPSVPTLCRTFPLFLKAWNFMVYNGTWEIIEFILSEAIAKQ